jgi:hypothetical protein
MKALIGTKLSPIAPKVYRSDAEFKEAVARALEADQERREFRRKLMTAEPTGERCRQKGCPYRAVFDGECRSHAWDRQAQASLLPSIHPMLMELGFPPRSEIL